MIELGVDRHAAALALDSRFSFRLRKQDGALKIDLGGSATMLIVHGLQGPGYDGDAVDRLRIHRGRRSRRLR